MNIFIISYFYIFILLKNEEKRIHYEAREDHEGREKKSVRKEIGE